MSKQQTLSALDKFQIIRPHLEQGISLSEISKEKELSPKTLKRWLKNYEVNGLKGLERKQRSDKGTRKIG